MEASGKGTAADWSVVVARAPLGGDASQGAQETVVVRGSEDEARRVYADEVAVAAEHGYQRVRLTQADRDVDLWPPATGWTS